mgnify:CR=1 FL=1
MEDIKSTTINEWDNPELRETVDGDNELKQWLVNYVGEKHQPENGNVTVEMIVAVASENFLRGYHQAFCDMELSKNENQHNQKTS